MNQHFEDHEQSILVAIVLFLLEDVVNELRHDQTDDLQMSDYIGIREELFAGCHYFHDYKESHAESVKASSKLTIRV